MKTELEERGRKWEVIKLSIDYGYFASAPPICIRCFSDGMLIFSLDGKPISMTPETQLYDSAHSITPKSLRKLDHLVEKIRRLKKLEFSAMMDDGPSFACRIYLSNGTVAGFHYVCMELIAEFAQLEKDLRKILREEFFLRKHKDQLTRLSRWVFPD